MNRVTCICKYLGLFFLVISCQPRNFPRDEIQIFYELNADNRAAMSMLVSLVSSEPLKNRLATLPSGSDVSYGELSQTKSGEYVIKIHIEKGESHVNDIAEIVDHMIWWAEIHDCPTLKINKIIWNPLMH